MAEAGGVPTQIAPLVLDIFEDGQARYGGRAWSSMIVKRLEDAAGCDLRADGFPPELLDDEPESPGYEVRADAPDGVAASHGRDPA
jgi:3-hydroxyisobutyrate dehydrogenase